jgi:hypothetical protein
MSRWRLVSLHVWKGPALTAHRYRGHDNLRAVAFVEHGPDVCGLGLFELDGDDWVNYGGYTYLHRPVAMYWPKDEAEFHRLEAGFDTLIYIKAPPDDLRFYAATMLWTGLRRLALSRLRTAADVRDAIS